LTALENFAVRHPRSIALAMAISLGFLVPLHLVAQADGLLPPKVSAETMPSAVTGQTTPNPPTAQPAAPLSAMVIQQPVLGETDAQGLIQVITSPIPFESRLQRTYQGYRITVQSDYPGILHVQSASINNGQNGTMAFETVRSSMTLVYASLFLGLAGFLLIGIPVLLVKNHRNDKIRTDALPFTNQIPLLDLAKGQTLHFDALVPLGQKPDISLSFLDRKSGLLFSKRAVQ
jgi:hypothetical protein